MKVIVLSGGGIDGVSAEDLPAVDMVIAADSGYRHARSLKVSVDLLVGDMDSISHELLAEAQASGIEIQLFPAEKDSSDLELAVDIAVERGATEIVLVDGGTGRFDHVMANVFLLARPDLAHVRMQAIVGKARLYVASNVFEITGEPGAVFSQFPVNGPVTNLVIEGTEWAGSYDRIEPGSTLCLHDTFTDQPVKFTFEGTMLFVVPGAVE